MVIMAPPRMMKTKTNIGTTINTTGVLGTTDPVPKFNTKCIILQESVFLGYNTCI